MLLLNLLFENLAKMDMEQIISTLISMAAKFTLKILFAGLVFVIGRWLIKLLNKFATGLIMKGRHTDPSVLSFVRSFINISLLIVLLISVINIMGIETSSFVALFASAGVAIGMALSGNLQNFAGGLIILLFKPYKVGDTIEAQNVTGTVKDIQIFSTVLITSDNKTIIIPNNSLSTGVVINYSKQRNRRVEWIVSIEYGQDFDLAGKVINELLKEDARVLKEPAPLVALTQLADSSVNIAVRAWTAKDNYWDLYFDMNRKIYNTFNQKGIEFPFPQLEVHLQKKKS